jgi:large subunit ribosomal protein L13
MIIDGTDAVLGRFGSRLAKLALLGETIDVVNCEKIVVTGKKTVVLGKYYHAKLGRGAPRKGPIISSDPQKFVKRMLRGMFPHKQTRGIEALARVKFYVGVPKMFEGKKFEKIGMKEIRVNTVTVAEICKFIGGKV